MYHESKADENVTLSEFILLCVGVGLTENLKFLVRSDKRTHGYYPSQGGLR